MGFVRFWTWVAGIALVLIGLARATVIRWWRVPSDNAFMNASIAPSLRPGDLIILWRATPPAFGDLVVCAHPTEPRAKVIARLVGDAHDEVRFEGDNIYINGSKIRTETSCDESPFSVSDPDDGHPVAQGCQIEAMGAAKHMRGDLSGATKPDMNSTHQVDVGQLFLVSDNRLYPHDSREYGTLPVAACKETVVFRLVSKKGYFDVDNRMMFVR